MVRPEIVNPPEIYYNDTEAKKYSFNSRIQTIQSELSERAVELLTLPSDKTCFLLDIGCGSGLSGEVLEENGHFWVGMDISESMLEVAKERKVEGDLFLHDVGNGFPFRPGSFDGAISISCLQWLCNADYKRHNPWKRLQKFFVSLYGCLKSGARAVFQFYPANPQQIETITSAAMTAGFGGGLVIDYPNSTKRKKYFLCLFVGSSGTINPAEIEMPKALLEGDEEMDCDSEYGSENDEYLDNDMTRGNAITSDKPKKRRTLSKSARLAKQAKEEKVEWIRRKKDIRRARGQNVANHSKYSGRKRRPRF